MQQLPLITTDLILAPNNRIRINLVLTTITPNVNVIASRITEDGYELVVEGSIFEIADCIYLLEGNKSL